MSHPFGKRCAVAGSTTFMFVFSIRNRELPHVSLLAQLAHNASGVVSDHSGAWLNSQAWKTKWSRPQPIASGKVRMKVGRMPKA